MKVSYRSFVIGLVFVLLLLLVNISLGEVIRVDSFGAVADGVTNSHAAIGRALKEAAAKKEKVTVQFGPGRYLITPEMPKAANPDWKQEPSKQNAEGVVKEEDLLLKQCDRLNSPHCFELSEIKDLTIQGDPKGTEIIITSPTADLLRIAKGSNITVKNMVIDYDPLPFTQGNIIAIDEKSGTFDFDLDKGFPSLSEYYFAGVEGKAGISYDATGRFRFGSSTAIFIDSWKHVKERIWRTKLLYPSQAKMLLVGDRFVHVARTNGKAVLFFYQCNNVSVQNVTIYTGSSSGIQFFECEGDLVANGFVVRPRPGTGRLLSTCADAIHCQSDRKGPLVENCLFTGFADDTMNFYSAPSIVTKVLAPNKVQVSTTKMFRAGDKAQIIEPNQGLLRANDLTVTAVEDNTLTFERDVPDMHVGAKNYMDSDTIYNLSACSGGFVVRNNIIGGIRGRGLVIRGGNGLVENNLIKDTSGQAIVICNEPSWPEGPMTHNTVVRNNVIWGVGRDSSGKTNSVITVAGCKSANWGPSLSRGIQGVVIENNTIINPPGTVMVFQSAKDVTVRNNMVQILDEHPGIENYYGINIANCEDVRIDGFIMTDPKKRIQRGVVIDQTDSLTSVNVTVENVIVDSDEKSSKSR
jgi:hypothetical protein